MRLLFAPLLLLVLHGVLAQGQGTDLKATYSGGSLADFQPGERMRFNIYQGRLRIFRDDATLVDLTAAAVVALSYGQDLHGVGTSIGVDKVSRGWEKWFSRPHAKHWFLALTWNREGTPGGAAFQVAADECPDAVAALERFSGKKAVHAEVTTPAH